MSAEIFQLRDYKRREERDADLARFQKQFEDAAPSEMPPVYPSYAAPETDPA